MPIFTSREKLKQELTKEIQNTIQKNTRDLSTSIKKGINKARASYQEQRQEETKQLTDRDRANVYNNDSIVKKGINKKSKNLFYKWHIADSPIDGEDIPEHIEQTIKEFTKYSQLIRKMMQDHINKSVFRISYLELINEEIIGEHGEGLEMELMPGLSDIENIDPRTILNKRVKNKDAIAVNPYQKNNIETDVEYYIQRWGKENILIHPSRIIESTEFKLGDQPTGVIDVAYRTATSKINGDWATGEILYRFGKPFVAVTIENGTDEEIQEVFAALGSLNPKTGFAADNRYKFEILNPEVIDPKEFYNIFYINLACALEMPLMVLLGVQKGQLTGSEVDLSDYYNDLHSIQETIYTPVISRIYEQLLGSWDYEIYWNPIFIDEKKNAEQMKIYSEIIKILYYDAGIIDDVTARQMCREWDIPIPEEHMLPEEESLEPEIEEIPVPYTEAKKTRKPTEEELKTWRDFCQHEEEEQEKRIKEANDKKPRKKTT